MRPVQINPKAYNKYDSAVFECVRDRLFILELGRGCWKQTNSENDRPIVISGFDGEVTITLHILIAQSGSWNVVGVRMDLDGPIVVLTRHGQTTRDLDLAAVSIVSILANYAEFGFPGTG